MTKTPSAAQLAAIKSALFALCLIPLAYYAQRWFDDALGANPIEAITRASGEWTLRFLLITLAVTPLRKLTGLNWLIRLRRTLGLFAFFYASLHFTTYVWLDQFFDLQAMARDIMKRPFITVGFAAFVLLVPLALTSNNYAIRRLGGRRWQSLHCSVYAIGILAIVHYWWLVKADILEPMIYGLILAALLGVRGWWREQERRRQVTTSMPPPRMPGAKVIPLVAKSR
ncbi:sulfite oxidase heme-binding subunit YedZ [Aromatoleum petrolei]|uniref:Protein-methionine-sulfoxide reductase heme-binding subunit MsrQ n=1 Tax=Aromatoleum petrolei TaxID=76116 RepID=A0ABX1MVQ4_9RHOO|nr:protein-methionine-sulfoxide reductase heme-binding subunit MsrQ [Aromatoleum petrolei]NMF90164.1 sulfoxide reductase heme-binding subunit YedZ [Aromatoleum petrolei]QTQ37664.1 Protein-methionine-sulfoxide reductase, heme-binding subunit [Aromatoleum petrolei]